MQTKLKELMREKGVTGAELSRACDISPTTVSGLKNGYVPMWPSYRKKIANYFRVPETDLMED